ncbi:acVLRF1 family peptidyl-tRNA hydrolase [Nocardioides sp. AX2bis]|uniref:acVLRF1 family peptidyl-tRNA hydrolase n=1 Tax=Nocardioides sp. AX2bis TaxID=2653157 RepID=UPI0012F3345E|nr:acVLRF1 family peptidyl-tRNA hydrolase [Nocardioides sp. AX2bis]VXB51107.1 Peptide chain release factor 1 [Nocardioides sp. AX2bis]
MTAAPATVLVPPGRVERWVDNVGVRHGELVLEVGDGALVGSAADGSSFAARLPFGRAYDGPADAGSFAAAVRNAVPGEWGLLLVRKGGFAVAAMRGTTTTASKVGQRHVQGRTKAGGQSQQRFARRRDNQARQAYEAAADHAARVLEDLARHGGPVVVGGDRAAVEEVLADPRLGRLEVHEPWLDVPDPRRSVLDEAALRAASCLVRVVNA